MIPQSKDFILDVELWPQENNNIRTTMIEAFRNFSENENFNILDFVNNSYIILIRIRCSKKQYEKILNYRDVRTVDLPPRYSLDYSLLETSISEIPNPDSLKKDAPSIAVLDSGISTNHPLLRTSIGDTRSYNEDGNSNDETGHGTAVSGIALYGDIEDSIKSKKFIPYFYILSGKVLEDKQSMSETFLENKIEKAVKEFYGEYNCKIFNFSIAFIDKPYQGGKVSSLTLTLDNLSHELGVLFIISAGNLSLNDIRSKLDAKRKYPNYLLENSNILEPANSINSLTVGSYTKYDMGKVAKSYPKDPTYKPLAPVNSISPFSRIGFGIGGGIKPELIAHGGNLSIDLRSKNLNKNELGVISLNSKFVGNNVFSEDIGTSFSAPYITHLAGRILSNSKGYSITFIKALLIASADSSLVKIHNITDKNDLVKMKGYGKVDEDFLFKSGEESVILFSSDKIQNNKNHFYEIPIPESFFDGKKRKRQITVSLSYNSSARNTRISYRASRISFRFVKSTSLEEVTKMFNKATTADEYENIKEYSSNRNISSKLRSKGTNQSSTWQFQQPKKSRDKFFVIVTRNDFPWGDKVGKEEEEYSLVISIQDKEAIEPKLYTQIKEKLDQKIKTSQIKN